MDVEPVMAGEKAGAKAHAPPAVGRQGRGQVRSSQSAPPREDTAGVVLDVNAALAGDLREYAYLLEQQDADSFRVVAACRRAAETLEALDRPAADLFAAEGRVGLMRCRRLGHRSRRRSPRCSRPAGGRNSSGCARRSTLTGCSRSFLASGWSSRRGWIKLLEAETPEALEVAAHEGRLEKVPGVGRRHAELIQAVLVERLGPAAPAAADRAAGPPARRSICSSSLAARTGKTRPLARCAGARQVGSPEGEATGARTEQLTPEAVERTWAREEARCRAALVVAVKGAAHGWSFEAVVGRLEAVLAPRLAVLPSSR